MMVAFQPSGLVAVAVFSLFTEMATCSIRSRKNGTVYNTCGTGTVNEMKHASTHHKKYTHTHTES